jgi:hypothetical protein
MKEELTDEEIGALMRWCGLGKGGGSKPAKVQENAPEKTDISPSPAPKIGHPYRRRLNQKGERQS